MESLAVKNNIVIWKIGSRNWILNYEELTTAYLTSKHPHTKKIISTAIQNRILYILKKIAGEWWGSKLKQLRNYKKISLNRLSQLKTTGKKLGSGKYGTVYSYKNYAIKMINHRFYKNLPRIDGKLESSILSTLQNKITFNYLSPNIMNIYQYQPDKKVDYIVMEKLDKTFWSYLQKEPNTRIVKGIILQVMFTLVILQHTFPGFRHNDLKVDNILLDLSPRTQKLTLRYKKYYWVLPTDVPLVKIADFDYSYIPGVHSNSKVGTKHAKTFGCTEDPSKVYDTHLFLNSLYSYRNSLSKGLVKWLTTKLPETVRGNENKGVKFGRLKNPKSWEGKIVSPLRIIISKYFTDFRTINPSYPMWGLKN